MFNYEERKEVPLFTFEKKDQVLEGILRKMEPVEIKGKRTIAYYFELTGGGTVKIHGTHQLNQKLGPRDIGQPVRIKYLGEDPEVQKNGNSMRRFWVGVDTKAKKAEELIITDADF